MVDLIALYLDDLRMRSLSPNTIQRRRLSLYAADRALPYGLDSATRDELKAWVYNDRWSIQTRSSYLTDIKGFFHWACDPEDPHLDYDPAARLPQPKVPRRLPRPISDEQLAMILNEVGEPYRTWALLAAYAGLRCCEIAGLRREHITEQWIEVTGKGNKPGTVPTHPDIWSAVRDLPPGPIAPAWTRQRLTAKLVSQEPKRAFASIGLVGVTMHRLRHWCGTNVQRQQGNLRVTQEILRHASPTSTAMYTAVADPQRTAAVSALPRVSSPRAAGAAAPYGEAA